jgi:hypothetical protein
MADDPMTLIERLRNPAWYSRGPGQDARLQVEQTLNDMREAAGRIQALTDALTEIERLGWKEWLGADHAIASHYAIRKVARDVLAVNQ